MSKSHDSARVDILFEQAIDLPSEQWESFLAQACGHDADLRNAVDQRLKAYQRVAKDTEFLEPIGANLANLSPGALNVRCPHCQSAIEILDASVLDNLRCGKCGSHINVLTSRDSEIERILPNTLQHFRLVEKLGTGSFGTVWKAEDTELHRMVAIKIPRKSQLDREDEEMFLREARVAASLRHPNIVSVHEIGRDATLYIVSDLIEGQSLSEWADAKQPNIREVVEICIRIAAGLEHAHHVGVIHRDLKPANILVDQHGVPHITDFGLAKRDTGEITMTMDGQILGTPAYMSPEQAKGESKDVSVRSDIYSLGVILFEQIAGRLPFEGSVALLVDQVANADVPSPRKFNKAIPKDLDTICLKCLRKEADGRYQTVRELADDLQRFLDYLPILARRSSLRERTSRWLRRRRRYVAMNAVFVAAGVGLAIAGISLLRFYNQQYYATIDFSTTESMPLTATLLDTQGTSKRFTIPTGDSIDIAYGDYQLKLTVPSEPPRYCDLDVNEHFDHHKVELNALGHQAWKPIPIERNERHLYIEDGRVVIWSEGASPKIRYLNGRTGVTDWERSDLFDSLGIHAISAIGHRNESGTADLLVVSRQFHRAEPTSPWLTSVALVSGTDGTTLWMRNEIPVLRDDSILDDDVITIPIGERIVIVTALTFEAISSSTGATVWMYECSDKGKGPELSHHIIKPSDYFAPQILEGRTVLAVVSNISSTRVITLFDAATGDVIIQEPVGKNQSIGVTGNTIDQILHVESVGSQKLVARRISNGTPVWEVQTKGIDFARILGDVDSDGVNDIHVFRRGDSSDNNNTPLDIYSGLNGTKLVSASLPCLRVREVAAIYGKNRLAVDCHGAKMLVTTLVGDVLHSLNWGHANASSSASTIEVGYVNSDDVEDLVYRTATAIETVRGNSPSFWRRIVADDAQLVGDVDSDGIADILLTNRDGERRGKGKTPRIQLLSGASGQVVWGQEIENSLSFHRCHDLSGDGAPDFIFAIDATKTRTVPMEYRKLTLDQLRAISGATGETIWTSSTFASKSDGGNDQVAAPMLSVAIASDERHRDVVMSWTRLTVANDGRTMKSTPMISRLSAVDGNKVWTTSGLEDLRMRVSDGLVYGMAIRTFESPSRLKDISSQVIDYSTGNSVMKRSVHSVQQRITARWPNHDNFRLQAECLGLGQDYEVFELRTGHYDSAGNVLNWAVACALHPNDGTVRDISVSSMSPNKQFAPIYLLKSATPKFERQYNNKKDYPAVIGRELLYELRPSSDTGITLHAIDLQSGKSNWATDATHVEVAIIRGEERDTLILSDDSSMWGMDAITGKEIWSSSKPTGHLVGIASDVPDVRLLFQLGNEVFCQRADCVD